MANSNESLVALTVSTLMLALGGKHYLIYYIGTSKVIKREVVTPVLNCPFLDTSIVF